MAAAACTPGEGRPGPAGAGAGSPAREAVPVAVAPADRGTISSRYTTTATLEVEREARVLARTEGLVESIGVEEGDDVEEGEVLLEIESEDYRYGMEKVAARVENLEGRFERLQEMSDDLISAEEFDTARHDLATARADLALARLQLERTDVRAPFAGRITERHVDAGQFVASGDALFTLADLEPLLARVHVPAREFRKLAVDREVELVLDSDGRDLRGRVRLVSPVIDPNTGTIEVTVEVSEYPDGTRPGDFAEVRIVTETRPDALLVPRSAVIAEEGQDVVFVARDRRAERRVVEVGFTDGDRTQVVSGVDAGELVVVKGQRSLEDGAPLEVLEELPARADPGAGA